MLRVTVLNLQTDRDEFAFGQERMLCDWLRDEFPEVLLRVSGDIDKLVAALNATDLYRASVTPYEPGVEANRLPEGYQTASQADEPDPWPRRGEPAE